MRLDPAIARHCAARRRSLAGGKRRLHAAGRPASLPQQGRRSASRRTTGARLARCEHGAQHLVLDVPRRRLPAASLDGANAAAAGRRQARRLRRSARDSRRAEPLIAAGCGRLRLGCAPPLRAIHASASRHGLAALAPRWRSRTPARGAPGSADRRGSRAGRSTATSALRPAAGPRRCPRRACGRTRPARRHGPCARRA